MRYEELAGGLFFASISQVAFNRLQDPDMEGPGPMRPLYQRMKGKPGLRAQLDEWGKTWPNLVPLLNQSLEEAERLLEGRD